MEQPVVIEQPDGGETIRGAVIAGGVECPLLKLDDGRVFALQGVTHGDAAIGSVLEVHGRPIAISTCQQGDAFLVIRFERLTP